MMCNLILLLDVIMTDSCSMYSIIILPAYMADSEAWCFSYTLTFLTFSARIICCAKNSPAVKKGEAKNAQVHVHGVTTTKRHDIKIWPRKHLQYRHFYAFIFYILHIITSS